MIKVTTLPGYEWINNGNFTKDAFEYSSCEHELELGEIWVGNTSGDDRWSKGVSIPRRYQHLKTVRLGEQAYDIYGKPLSRDYCRPLIINKTEEIEYERAFKNRV
mgnify:CR=1 FL=1